MMVELWDRGMWLLPVTLPFLPGRLISTAGCFSHSGRVDDDQAAERPFHFVELPRAP